MDIRVYRTKTKTIETIEFEEYLCGVVPAEIGVNHADAALQAQAVCSRTYAYRFILSHKNKDYDIKDDSSHQVYKPERKNTKTTAAVRATEGLILTYKNAPIGGWFSSSNPGYIRSSKEKWGGKELPYSVHKPDPFDTYGGGGHGVGMSQRGAMAMGDQGYTYIDILDFYWNDSFDYTLLPYSTLQKPEHGGKFMPYNTEEKDVSNVPYSRVLKRYKSGDDVLRVKQKLVKLGYLTSATHDTYGNDTYNAVKKFQDANNLEVDGHVGQLTWNALFADEIDEDEEVKPTEATEIPDWYSDEARTAIGADLAATTELRRNICLEALQWASEALNPTKYLKGFYIRGGNGYNKDLQPNIMTKAKLTAYFKKSSYSGYFDNGRKEMMLKQCEADGYNKMGSDCSGFIVGLWRKFKLKNASFDASANSLYSSYCTKTSNPRPGDLAWKSGHIGIYVGGGYIVEAAGGAYGIQLTKAKSRKCYNYVTGKLQKMGAWSAYGDPKFFD